VRELLALAVGFLLIIVMLYRKIGIGTTMFAASIAMGFVAGFGPLKNLTVLFHSVTERATIELLAVVTIICILSFQLQKYGILDRMADSLEDLFNNNKFSIMFMPLLVGVLSIPGGAAMSAPVVDSVGDKLKFDNVRKAMINVVFRHMAFFLFPFTTTMILAIQVAQISPYVIIAHNTPIALVSITVAYMIYIRDGAADSQNADGRSDKEIMKKVYAVLKYTSPLWVGIVLNLAFGMPFYLALVPGIGIVYFLAQKDKEGFLKGIGRGINWNMIYAVAGIMCLQGFIKEMPAIAMYINTLLESGMDMRILIILSTAVMGLLTANSTAVVGMFLPMFLPLASDVYTKAYITSLIFASSFLFYYISPMHLCRIFTAEYFGVKLKDLYLEYRIYWPVITLATIILYIFIY